MAYYKKHNTRIKIARKTCGLGPRYRSAVYAKRYAQTEYLDII